MTVTIVESWMLFVDGENLTLRAQELAKQNAVALDADPKCYLQDVFVWFPGWPPTRNTIFSVSDLGTRAYYYASAVGDDPRILAVRQSLRALGFDPQVFKRPSGVAKSKGVDITLTKDVLSHAFQDHYDDAVIIAGDGDYVPLVEEVKRRGKRVHLGFFRGEGLGLSEELRLAADRFTDLTAYFLERWREHIEDLNRARAK
jgi:hypothetical protein